MSRADICGESARPCVPCPSFQAVGGGAALGWWSTPGDGRAVRGAPRTVRASLRPQARADGRKRRRGLR